MTALTTLEDGDWLDTAEVMVVFTLLGGADVVWALTTDDDGLLYGTGMGMEVVPDVLQEVEIALTTLLLGAVVTEELDVTGTAGTVDETTVVSVEVEVHGLVVAGPTGDGAKLEVPVEENKLLLATLNPKLE